MSDQTTPKPQSAFRYLTDEEIKDREKFVITTAIRRMSKLTKRTKVIPGGTSAGKTFGILPILINKAMSSGYLRISVVSESIPHLRRGALNDFEKIMRITGRYHKEQFNQNMLRYTFKNGSYIEFFSADQEDKIRGARREILYVNECNNMKFATYESLSIRTVMEVWLDFNPTMPFWAHEHLSNDPDAEWLTLTYKDNEALPQEQVREIEKRRELAKTSSYYANWWRVYGLGLTGSLEGAVFNDWEIQPSAPRGSKLLGYGLDFGYSNDPTAIVATYRTPTGRILFDEVCYQTKMTNADIAKFLRQNGVKSGHIIIADSAEPKSIEELRREGFRIRGVKKGADSILFGITTLQEVGFDVTERSVNLIKELRHYMWEKDDMNNSINKPIDAYNHLIDAMRYFAMMMLTRRRASKRGIRRAN